MYPESTKRQEASNGRRIAGVVDGSCACDVSDCNGVSLAGGGQQLSVGTDGGRADDGAENHYGTENFRKRE